MYIIVDIITETGFVILHLQMLSIGKSAKANLGVLSRGVTKYR